MPRSPLGKIDVAIAPSDSKRMYALIQTADQGSLWRSDDGGTTFNVVSWDRSLIGRAGYYVRLAVNPQDPNDVIVMNSGFHRSKRRRQAVPGQRRLRRLPRHLVRSEGRHALRADRRRRRNDLHGAGPDVRAPAERADVPRGRRQPRAVLDLQQSPGRRHDARAEHEFRADRQRPARGSSAGRSRRRGRGGRGAGGGGGGGRGGRAGGPAWEPNLGGCESGFTHATARRRQHRLGLVLRQQAHAVGCATAHGAIGVARDDHVRLGAGQVEVPLPLDGAGHHRCVRAQHRLLRLPGDLEDDQRRPELDADQPGPVDAGSEHHRADRRHRRRTTSASSPARSSYAIASSPKEKGLVWAGTNDGKVWYTRNGGGNWMDVTKNITGMPQSRDGHADLAVDVRRGTAYVTDRRSTSWTIAGRTSTRRPTTA